MNERDKYLAELIMLEGRGTSLSQESCIQCGIGSAEYRCSDCFGSDLFCGTCLISAHKLHPFHVIKVRILL